VRVMREANRVSEWVRVADFFVDPPQKMPGEVVHLVDKAFSLLFFNTRALSDFDSCWVEPRQPIAGGAEGQDMLGDGYGSTQKQSKQHILAVHQSVGWLSPISRKSFID